MKVKLLVMNGRQRISKESADFRSFYLVMCVAGKLPASEAYDLLFCHWIHLRISLI